jgi:hypothetical protein
VNPYFPYFQLAEMDFNLQSEAIFVQNPIRPHLYRSSPTHIPPIACKTGTKNEILPLGSWENSGLAVGLTTTFAK